MPRLLQAMKDVISCDKPRGEAAISRGEVQMTLDPRISEWDNPMF